MPLFLPSHVNTPVPAAPLWEVPVPTPLVLVLTPTSLKASQSAWGQ